MTRFALLLLLGAALPAQPIPLFDLELPAGRFEVFDWNGRTAVIVWGTSSTSSSVADVLLAQWQPSVYAVRLKVEHVFVDHPACAAGIPLLLRPFYSAPGPVLQTPPQPCVMLSRPESAATIWRCRYDDDPMCRWSSPPFNWTVGYCFDDACRPSVPFCRPNFWAILATVDLTRRF